MIVQILIVNTAFYIFGDIRFKEVSILNSFEQIQEKIIAGSAFSARHGSSAVAFIPDHLFIVDGYASLFNCLTAVRASDSMTASS